MKRTKNPAASVKARLLLLAQKQSEPFEAIMLRYAFERLLYRLGCIISDEDFLLKGGLLLGILSNSPYRQTRDLDLLGKGDPNVERLVKIFSQASLLDFPEDGLRFSEDIRTQTIKEEQDYPGVRLILNAFLENARLTLQVDIGFGDAVLKPYQPVLFEPLLGFPLPEIQAYPVESILAEKFHALYVRGLTTSRMKDIYDLWYLITKQTWGTGRVLEAIQLTFERRRTPMPIALPIMFTPDFYEDSSKLSQWEAFQKTIQVKSKISLQETLTQLKNFWWPLFEATQLKSDSVHEWNPETGNWQKQ
ncbi:nucleotidyl transferase AbiEii/AbiGii toxin family protein [bacterium (Candidatus Blackallbacteria) CG17_big_fil_post_rev_8_21_14_2_50_48_46]|uniref:Nucleotidyl transferase AbiEii/AbiGii toxin family protein n=1 Tax=bacterium (Candidatus Blackallbacteria) CG17_big_fil_post_rev_8_21_14_2_50_48_46 TaxID=2014261 RepID=A0A2M7G587_9BACT|nr:MAG: hypothetical protein COW64_07190 [bacterium (Candidatus Blackallbacteria) CG18_big_fil_WC_8_21_14_2_50_49_26]PIW17106.1 MAG: nucleotidyl transferase AbiEii/AbiGii toxin family protein [bacterium (Candidatus Blackallbacteria) CG17_big_fil_post_rev_8_21_14_2_50_48_46]PIW49178.1 MAG: nucleotidyl transferase AbiEii/AbiGii toxin family protein [bacterium (Candidatus Blackallbacteria) CG13_big_fil_rev_8_21_14_2_50_49_14]